MEETLSAFRRNFPDSLIILSLFLTGWTALGLFLGRGIAGWFPFLRTSRFRLPIPGRRLQRLLISEETSHWGKTRPRYLHVKYYQVAPWNRSRMNLWGVLFYAAWFLFPLLLLSPHLPRHLRDLAYALTLACPLLIRLAAGLDYDSGLRRALQAEQREREEQQEKEEQTE